MVLDVQLRGFGFSQWRLLSDFWKASQWAIYGSAFLIDYRPYQESCSQLKNIPE